MRGKIEGETRPWFLQRCVWCVHGPCAIGVSVAVGGRAVNDQDDGVGGVVGPRAAAAPLPRETAPNGPRRRQSGLGA